MRATARSFTLVWDFGFAGGVNFACIGTLVHFGLGFWVCGGVNFACIGTLVHFVSLRVFISPSVMHLCSLISFHFTYSGKNKEKPQMIIHLSFDVFPYIVKRCCNITMFSDEFNWKFSAYFFILKISFLDGSPSCNFSAYFVYLNKIILCKESSCLIYYL